MIQKPRLKSFLNVFPMSETRWVFRGGSNEICRVDLRNEKAVRTFNALLPCLDGTQHRDEIFSYLATEEIDTAAASALLKHLEASHCLEEGETAGLSSSALERHSDQILYFSHFTSDGGAGYQAALASSHAVLIGEGRFGDVLERQLTEVGIGIVERSSEASLLHAPPPGLSAGERRLVVIAQESYDRKLLENMDIYSKRFDVPWLLVRRISISEGWVGPLFIPGETASYLSFEAKLRGNIPFFELHEGADRYLAVSSPRHAPAGTRFADLEVLAGIAISESVKFLTGFQVPHLAGRFVAVDLSNWAIESHDVWRVPVLDRTAAPQPQPFPWKEALYGQTGTHRRRA
jgi:hypothetical protein